MAICKGDPLLGALSIHEAIGIWLASMLVTLASGLWLEAQILPLLGVAGGYGFAAINAVIDASTLKLAKLWTHLSFALVSLSFAGVTYHNRAWEDAFGAISAAVCLTGCYWLLHRMNPSALGVGDVRLSLPLALSVAMAQPQSVLLMALFASAIQCVPFLGCWASRWRPATQIALCLENRQYSRLVLPFGPALVAGAWIAWLISLP